MKSIDRIIFGTIAVALMLLALQPYLVNATGHRDHVQRVDIHAIGGYRVNGAALPTTNK